MSRVGGPDRRRIVVVLGLLTVGLGLLGIGLAYRIGGLEAASAVAGLLGVPAVVVPFVRWLLRWGRRAATLVPPAVKSFDWSRRSSTGPAPPPSWRGAHSVDLARRAAAAVLGASTPVTGLGVFAVRPTDPNPAHVGHRRRVLRDVGAPG